MKLTLQLIVFILNAPTKFHDNFFKFTLYTIIIYKVGDTRCHLRRHALIQHNFSHEIRTPTETKHARIVLIGQQQIQKPMKLSQIEKRIPQTLTNSKDVIQKGREYARRSSRARSTRGQENEAWALYKKIHPGCPGLTFLGTDTQLYQSQPPLLEIHLLEGYCSPTQASFSWPRVDL